MFKRVKLSDIGEIVSGGTPKTKVEDYWNGNIPWITPKDLSDHTSMYIDKGERCITKDGLNNSSAKIIPKGTVLFTSRAPIGYLAIANNEVTTNQGFKSIIVNENNYNYFVYYLLKNNISLIESVANGSTFKEISGSAMKNIEVNIPSLEEQKVIANILLSLDRKIEINNMINKKLEEMAQAIFKQWFVDFEFPNENGEPYKSSGGEMVESEMGTIPKGWEITTLDDICYFNRETYSSKETLEYINYLDTSNITENKIDTIQKIYCYSDKIPSRAKRKVIKDSIVYSTVRPNQLHYGIIKKPIENMIVSTGFVVIDSKIDFVNSDLIYLWLTQDEITAKLQAIGETSTSTYPSIKPSDIKSIKIIFPKRSVIDAISNSLSKIYLNISILNDENKKLSELRDNLLPKLMSGEIRVPLNN